MEKDFVSAVLTLDGEVNRDSAVRSFYLVVEGKKKGRTKQASGRMGRAAAGTDLPIQRRGEIGMEGFPQPARQSSLLGRSDRPRFRPTGLGSAAVAMATGENPDRPRSRAVAHAHTNTHTHAASTKPSLAPEPTEEPQKTRLETRVVCVYIYVYIRGDIVRWRAAVG